MLAGWGSRPSAESGQPDFVPTRLPLVVELGMRGDKGEGAAVVEGQALGRGWSLFASDLERCLQVHGAREYWSGNIPPDLAVTKSGRDGQAYPSRQAGANGASR